MNDQWSYKPEWLTEEIEQELKFNNFPLNQDGLLMLHKCSQESLTHWKQKEMSLRKVVAQVLVPAKTEGTTNVDLGNNYTAKVKYNYNYKLDKDNNKIWSSLDKIKKIGNIGALVAERLVSWTPNFLKTEYNNLMEDAANSEDAKAILKIINEEMITIEEGSPTVEIKEPKAKK